MSRTRPLISQAGRLTPSFFRANLEAVRRVSALGTSLHILSITSLTDSTLRIAAVTTSSDEEPTERPRLRFGLLGVLLKPLEATSFAFRARFSAVRRSISSLGTSGRITLVSVYSIFGSSPKGTR